MYIRILLLSLKRWALRCKEPAVPPHHHTLLSFCVGHLLWPQKLTTKGQRSCAGSGAQVLWGEAEGMGWVSLEKRRLRGETSSPSTTTTWQEVVVRWGSEVVASSCTRGGSGWILGRISSQKEWWCTGTHCLGRCGVTDPGGVEEKGKYCIEWHGLAAWWWGVDGWTLAVFPTLMIVWFYDSSPSLLHWN